MQELFDEVKKIRIYGNARRKSINTIDKQPKSMMLGMRFDCITKKPLECVNNSKCATFMNVLDTQIKTVDPLFSYTSVMVNKNFKCKPHKDVGNFGDSYIIGLGDYTGGDININGINYDIHNTWLKFDGKLEHFVQDFTGDRYTIVLFTQEKLLEMGDLHPPIPPF